MKRATEAATTGGVHPRSIINEYLWWLIAFVILIVIAFGIKNYSESKSRNSIGQESRPQTRPVETGDLSVAPGADSKHIRTKPGYRLNFTGSGFITHCIYRDGTPEGIWGDPVRPCKDGPMLEMFVHNTSTKTNIVTYEFVRP